MRACANVCALEISPACPRRELGRGERGAGWINFEATVSPGQAEEEEEEGPRRSRADGGGGRRGEQRQGRTDA